MGTAFGALSALPGAGSWDFLQRVSIVNNCFVCVRRLGSAMLISLEEFRNVVLFVLRGSVDACLMLDMVEPKSTRLVGHFENE